MTVAVNVAPPVYFAWLLLGALQMQALPSARWGSEQGFVAQSGWLPSLLA